MLLTLSIIVGLTQELLQLGAASISSDDPVPSVNDLTDQILEILNYFR